MRTKNSKPSFFDDDKKKERFEFQKMDSRYDRYLQTSPIIATNLICYDLSSNQEYSGLYVLHSQILAFYKNKLNSSPQCILKVGYSQLKVLAHDHLNQTYGFRIIKNGYYFDFHSPSKEVVEKWVCALKNVCVLTNFEEEYIQIKSLGSGTFSKVYLIESNTTRKRFAAKVFSKQDLLMNTKGNSKASVLNEISLMRALSHNNVIKLNEVYETDRAICLIIELIQNKSLREFLKNYSPSNFSNNKIMSMMFSLLNALAYLASKGIMHRDLKPANILLDNDQETLKIIDFGLATTINTSKFIFRKCGTPGYIAPEVFSYNPSIPSSSYDDRCDVFSAGCIFFNMLFGEKLFDGRDTTETLDLNRSFSVDSEPFDIIFKELNNPFSDFDKQALDLLLCLIEPDPKRRITAEMALGHPYFEPIQKLIQPPATTIVLTTDPGLKENQTTEYLSLHNRALEENAKNQRDDSKSPISPATVKFTERGSLYLDSPKTMRSSRLESFSDYVERLVPQAKLNSPSANEKRKSFSEMEIKYKDPKFNINPHRCSLAVVGGSGQQKSDPSINSVGNQENKGIVLHYGKKSKGSISYRPDYKPQGDFLEVSFSLEEEDIGTEDTNVQENIDLISKASRERHPGKLKTLIGRPISVPRKNF